MGDEIREPFVTTLYRYKAHHVLLWVSYFLFWVLFYHTAYPTILPLVFNTGVYFIFTASAFYITGYYLFPRFLYRNAYTQFFLWLCLTMLVLSIGLSVCLYYIFRIRDEEFANNITALFQMSFLSISTMAGLLCAIKLVTDRIKQDRTNRLADKQRLESELQYLKAQVNPHFLFNAINSVYFLIKKNPDQAAETLIKLSDLLRYQLYDCSDERIGIEKEMEYLGNFIALEKIRKGEKVTVNFMKEDMLSGFEIAPFLLIPFLENAFKYVSNFNGKENRISITFRKNDKVFTAEISNTTDNVIKNPVGRIGLKNVKRRLELLYPEKHELKINDEVGYYSIYLSLIIA